MSETQSTPTSSDGASAPLTHEDRSRLIRAAIRGRSRELRAAHPVLAHQSAIGASILAMATLVVLGAAYGYFAGLLAWWVVVPVAALAMSVAHEIEHDQIHRLYFTRNTRAQDAMLAVCWLLRPYTVSPWVRRPLHLLHHEASGTERDIEERAITNGRPWGPRRLVMMVDPLAQVLLSLPEDRELRRYVLRRSAAAYFPLGYVALAIWYSFIGLAAVSVFAGVVVSGPVVATVQFLATVWIAPNVLRVACLHFISSNMHYYGDVEDGNVIQQTQVLDVWWLAPIQAFCWNFGRSHSIHHFVPRDPFYLRQMTVRVGHDAMREHGVRFNDLGTFGRANRYTRGKSTELPASSVAA